MTQKQTREADPIPRALASPTPNPYPKPPSSGVRYGGSMRSRARHWSRTALAMAVLFGVLALGSKILLGTWPFDGAPELSIVCLVVAAYFHIGSRHRVAALPDPAVLLDQAFHLVSAGQVDDAIALLTGAVHLSPHLWQAFQYRGELYLLQQNAETAARDFSEAIRLAPQEQHLYTLRDRANGAIGAASGFETIPESHDSGGR